MARPLARNQPPTGPHRRIRRAFLVVAGVLSILLAGGSVWSIATIVRLDKKLDKVETGPDCVSKGCLRHVETFCEKTCTFLILGSDSRAGLTKDQQVVYGDTKIVKDRRSDTIIVVRFDARNDRTVVLHIPRDLWVEIPGYGMAKVNTAFEHGGDLVVHTVENLTGLNINHYVEINFQGFINLVDVLGGVPICINRPMIDELAGLHLPHKGCYNLHGPQALAFVRARHVEGDAIPDFSRIARQQLFLRAVLAKILSPQQVLRASQLVEAAKENLRMDDGLSLVDLHDLTNELSQIGQKDIIFRVVPSVPDFVDGVSILRIVQPDAEKLFRRLRQGHRLGRFGLQQPGLPITPAQIVVRIFDAGNARAVEEVEQHLARAGYIVLSPQPAPPDLRRSRILYGKRFAKQANSVSSYLPRVPLLFDETHTAGASVTVVVAPDFPRIE